MQPVLEHPSHSSQGNQSWSTPVTVVTARARVNSMHTSTISSQASHNIVKNENDKKAYYINKIKSTIENKNIFSFINKYKE